MSIYVYRPQSSVSARALATAVEGIRWRQARPAGGRLPVAGDVVVSWGGGPVPNLDPGVLVLNGVPLGNKFEDAVRLTREGVATVEVSRTRPAAPAPVPTTDPALAAFQTAQDLAGDFAELDTYSRTPVMTQGTQTLINALMALNTALGRPIPTTAPASTSTWLPRMFNHVGGNDLLTPPTTPDYFSRKLNLREEYRIHAFDGRSIRAGRKVLRDGFALRATPNGVLPAGTQEANPWVRSFDGGWRINYDGFESSRAMRDLAATACRALGLVFGAVDLGLTTDNRLIVLEVNRAAGLEGNTIEAYATAITRYVAEHGTADQRRAAA